MTERAATWRRRRCAAAAIAVVAVLAPMARAAEIGPGASCAPTDPGDRSTEVVTPGSTLNQASVWVSGDTGPHNVGVHIEPWHREAYFLDAGVGTDGTAAASASVDGASHAGYGSAAAGTSGDTCAGTRLAGTAASSITGADVVAGPGAAATGFLTRTAVLRRGQAADFVNADTTGHTVMSADRDALGVPLFRSAYATAGTTAPIDGVERLQPGSYAFYCSIHPGMTGTLEVLQ